MVFIDRTGLSPLGPYKPDPRINRPGPTDQSGRNGGRTGRPVSGPFHTKPRLSDKIAEFFTKQLLKRGLDLAIPGAARLFGNPYAVAIGGVLYSPNLNEGEFDNNESKEIIGDDPVFTPLPDSNSPDAVPDPIRDIFCQLNPGAPNCISETSCQ